MDRKFFGLVVSVVALAVFVGSGFPQSSDEVRNAQAQYNKVLEDAERNFKDGLEAFKANKRADSGARFDKAVEVFLYSSFNIQRDGRLQGCYQQLIETVYRIEFPSAAQPPQIRQLASTCGWNWKEKDLKLGDDVAQLSRTSTQMAPQNGTVASKGETTSIENARLSGFNEQTYEPSPLDELQKLELTDDELMGLDPWRKPLVQQPVAGESWLSISNRTGVSVADLMAANPGMKDPKGKVYVPLNDSGRITATSYSRPLGQTVTGVHDNVKIVRAQAGDTIQKVAERNGVDIVEVAKYNGLLPNSVLSAGREIKIPSGGMERPITGASDGTPARTLKTFNCSSFPEPVVQKLKLGLAVSEVGSRLGRKLTLIKNPYTVDTSYYAAFRSKGARLIYLGFYVGKLFQIGVEYDDSIKWRGLNEFQRAVAASLGLPNEWNDTEVGSKNIACDAFDITVSRTYNPQYALVLSDPRIYLQMVNAFRFGQQQLEKEQERKRKAFKP